MDASNITIDLTARRNQTEENQNTQIYDYFPLISSNILFKIIFQIKVNILTYRIHSKAKELEQFLSRYLT